MRTTIRTVALTLVTALTAGTAQAQAVIVEPAPSGQSSSPPVPQSPPVVYTQQPVYPQQPRVQAPQSGATEARPGVYRRNDTTTNQGTRPGAFVR